MNVPLLDRPGSVLSLLAGGPSLLRRQHIRRGRLGEEEVRARAGGLF